MTLLSEKLVKRIQNLKQKGWTVTLYYLALENLNLSKQRVEERVLHGGHNIPAQDIERRFPKSVYNLFYHYIEAVDSVYCYLNMSAPQLIFSKKQGEVVITNHQHYENLKGIADGYH